MARKKRAACLKPHVENVSKTQSKQVSTNLKCHNVTDKTVFVEGLQNAGLNVVTQLSSSENDPSQVIISLQPTAAALQIVKALHGCTLEGKKICVNITSLGTNEGNKKGQVPKAKYIRCCVGNAFRVAAFKKDLARQGLEYAVARQNHRTEIKAPKVATKKKKADNRSAKEEGWSVPRVELEPENDESKGLAEEIHKHEGGEEQGEMRDVSIKRETSATPQMQASEIQSDLRSERSQIQDTASEGERSYSSGMIKSTDSPAPDDMLSALFASLNEGKDAVPDNTQGFDMVDNLV